MVFSRKVLAYSAKNIPSKTVLEETNHQNRSKSSDLGLAGPRLETLWQQLAFGKMAEPKKTNIRSIKS